MIAFILATLGELNDIEGMTNSHSRCRTCTIKSKHSYQKVRMIFVRAQVIHLTSPKSTLNTFDKVRHGTANITHHPPHNHTKFFNAPY